MEIPCAKSELMIFDPIPTQMSMSKANWVDIYPISTVHSNVPIEFVIHPSNDSYLDLNDTILYVKCKITSEDKEKTAPINLLLSSLFSDVELSLNEKQIDGSDYLYPYKAYISTLLNYDLPTKKSQLLSAGFLMDQSGKFDAADNKAHVTRTEWCKNSIELMGGLQLGFLQQSKYLLPGVKLRLKLTRSKNDFCLMNFSAKNKCSVEMESVVLYIRKVSVDPNVMRAHMDGMMKNNAIYPIQTQKITSFGIPQGSMSDSREILIGSELPKLLIVGFVESKAFNGDLVKNPFNFQHFDLGFISVLKDGESVPGPPLKLDFDQNIFLRGYMSMVQNLEMFLKVDSNGLTPKDFSNGSSLFVFNLTSDLSFSSAQKYSIGNLRLDLQFHKPLPESINVILYSLHDGKVEITREGVVFA